MGWTLFLVSPAELSLLSSLTPSIPSLGEGQGGTTGSLALMELRDGLGNARTGALEEESGRGHLEG